MRTKDQIINMQLTELQRMNRRFTVFMIANHKESAGFVDGHGKVMHDAVEAIRRTIREVPDGA